MRTVEADQNTVDRLVWALERGAPFNLGEHFSTGETFVVVYPGTKSVVVITRNGMATREEKQRFLSELRANGIGRNWWPPALMLNGYLPLRLRVKSIMSNGEAVFEIRSVGQP